MEGQLQKQIKMLKAYAVVSSLLFAVLIFMAAKGPSKKAKFDEIDAERINILEKNGTLRLAIANNDRMPGGTLGGVELKSREGKRGGAGMIFYNDEGDECGGFILAGKTIDGKPAARVGISFDHYRQNEAITVSHSERNGERQSALEVLDQPMTQFSAAFVREMEDIETRVKDGPEKIEAQKKLAAKYADQLGWTPRVFVGRSQKDGAAVILKDDKARPRIRLAVDPSNVPTLQFLDENGKVIYSLPNTSTAK